MRSQSPLYTDIMSGSWPPDRFPFMPNGRSRRVPYYLADGTYPKYPIFARLFAKPVDAAQRTYNGLQEALREDAERLYAVLTNQFNIPLYPARFSNVSRIINTGKAIAILDNMVVIERRDGFLSRTRTASETGSADFHRPNPPILAGGGRDPPVGRPVNAAAGGAGDLPVGGPVNAAAGGVGGPPVGRHDRAVVGGCRGQESAAARAGASRLPVLPEHGGPQPEVQSGSALPEAWFLRSLLARAVATSSAGHNMLCVDLAAHAW